MAGLEAGQGQRHGGPLSGCTVRPEWVYYGRTNRAGSERKAGISGESIKLRSFLGKRLTCKGALLRGGWRDVVFEGSMAESASSAFHRKSRSGAGGGSCAVAFIAFGAGGRATGAEGSLGHAHHRRDRSGPVREGARPSCGACEHNQGHDDAPCHGSCGLEKGQP